MSSKIAKSADMNGSAVAFLTSSEGSDIRADGRNMIEMVKTTAATAGSSAKKAAKKILFSVDPLNVVQDSMAIQKIIDIKRCILKDPDSERLFLEQEAKDDFGPRRVLLWLFFMVALGTFYYGFYSVGSSIASYTRLIALLAAAVTFQWASLRKTFRNVFIAKSRSVVEMCGFVYLFGNAMETGFVKLKNLQVISTPRHAEFLNTLPTQTLVIIALGTGLNLRISALLASVTIASVVSKVVAIAAAGKFSGDANFLMNTLIPIVYEIKICAIVALTMYRIKVSSRMLFDQNRRYGTPAVTSELPDQSETQKERLWTRMFSTVRKFKWYQIDSPEYEKFYAERMYMPMLGALTVTLAIDSISSVLSFGLESHIYYGISAIKLILILVAGILLLVTHKAIRSMADETRKFQILSAVSALCLMLDSAALIYETIVYHKNNPPLVMIVRKSGPVWSSIMTNALVAASAGLTYTLFITSMVSVGLSTIVIYPYMLGYQLSSKTYSAVFEDNEISFWVVLMICLLILRRVNRMWHTVYRQQNA